MVPAVSYTQIIPRSSNKTGSVNADVVLVATRTSRGVEVATGLFTAVRVSCDPYCNQCHNNDTDIRVFKLNLRRNGLKRLGKIRRTSRAGTSFSRLKSGGQKTIPRLFRITKGTVEFARKSGSEYLYVFPEQELSGGSL